MVTFGLSYSCGLGTDPGNPSAPSCSFVCRIVSGFCVFLGQQFDSLCLPCGAKAEHQR